MSGSNRGRDRRRAVDHEWEPDPGTERLPGMVSYAAYDAAALIYETENFLRRADWLRREHPVWFLRVFGSQA